MSSFGSHKSFEKSLRSSSYQVPLTSVPKIEVHKCCTGKAHACGTLKSANTLSSSKTSSTTPKLKVKDVGKPLRKNSLSSETVSDSGSEISSWNSNKEPPPPNLTHSKISPLKRTKSVNYGSSHGSVPRRRTSEGIIASDVCDFVSTESQSNQSLIDSKILTNRKTDDPKLQRVSSFRLRKTPPAIPLKPKPAQSGNVAAARKNASLNNRFRNSFRNGNQQISWQMLWETSLDTKLEGGRFKNFDQNIQESAKVNF